MEKLDPFHGSPSKHESWEAWATLSAEDVQPAEVDHSDEETVAEPV